MSSSNLNQTNDHGIGIIDFLKHKNYFITGSTGFIAKVFIEKLLREVPEVQKVYLLMRAKNAVAAMQRLKTEIIDCELFKRLKDEHGKGYDEYMRSKLIPVVGNVSEPCLGMDADLARIFADQIDVIINTVGNTKWHERYDVLLDVNVRGLSRLLGYAMNCKKLRILLHVSTAYVETRLEVNMEKPIYTEESVSEKQNSNLNMRAALDIEAELEMVSNFASCIPIDKLQIEMAKLGIRRAKILGWPNTYVLTKAMGEVLITKLREKLPLIIIRPTLVESTLREPFPGWIEGYRVMDPMILSYGKGQLQGFLGDPIAILDVVPVDMVVNTMMAAIANHGIVGEPGVNIYHVSSSKQNPLFCHKLFEFCCNYFTLHPLKTSRGELIRVKDMEFFTSLDEYILFGLDSKPSNDKICSKLARMAVIYRGTLLNPSRFSNKNTQDLFGKMSREEKKIFELNMKNINWEDYFMNIHFYGLRKHILKEKFLPPKL